MKIPTAAEMGAWRRAFAALCCFTPLLGRRRRWRRSVGLHRLARLRAVSPAVFCLAVVAQALWLRAGHVGPQPETLGDGDCGCSVDPHHLDEFRFALRITVGRFRGCRLYAFFLNRLKSKGATHDDGILHSALACSSECLAC